MHGWAANTKYRRKFLTETNHWERLSVHERIIKAAEGRVLT